MARGPHWPFKVKQAETRTKITQRTMPLLACWEFSGLWGSLIHYQMTDCCVLEGFKAALGRNPEGYCIYTGPQKSKQFQKPRQFHMRRRAFRKSNKSMQKHVDHHQDAAIKLCLFLSFNLT